MATEPTDPPFDRPLPHESAKAFAAFATYRDMGPERSIRKARDRYGDNAATLRWWETWSSSHEWVARAEAFDRWLDAQVLERRRDEHLQMAERHAKTAQAGLALVAREIQILELREQGRVQELRRRTENGMPIDPELLKPTIPPQALARLMDVTVKVERISAGMATDIVQAVPYEEMTDEELERLNEEMDRG